MKKTCVCIITALCISVMLITTVSAFSSPAAYLSYNSGNFRVYTYSEHNNVLAPNDVICLSDNSNNSEYWRVPAGKWLYVYMNMVSNSLVKVQVYKYGEGMISEGTYYSSPVITIPPTKTDSLYMIKVTNMSTESITLLNYAGCY